MLKLLWWQGADAAQPALRQRHQGPGRLAHLLRVARRLGRRRQPDPGPGGRDPEPRQRRRLRRRHSGHLEAEARRHLARRQALHRRRRASSPGSTPRDPATAASTIGVYKDIRGREDRLAHRDASPSPSRRRSGPPPSSAAAGMIIPKHLFERVHRRQVARRARPTSSRWAPGRTSSSTSSPATWCAARSTPNYHMPNRPYFDSIEMKGGGDATSAARAVLQTGEYDWAWNLQVEDEVLKRMEDSGKGKRVRDPERRHRVHPAQPDRPVDRGRRRTRARQEQALRVQRPGGARGDGAAGRPQEHPGVHLRPHRHRDRQLPEQPAEVPLAQHEARVQHRQGQPAARRRGLEEGRRRHPREGRQEAEVRLPDQRQLAAPEGAGGRQAGARRRPASTWS